MLGKSAGSRFALAATVGIAIVALPGACAHNVPQDKATGTDGKIKGAKELRFENGEAKASGIVTYPGGDRVDWKVLEVPDKQRGTLDFKLTWNPPRPNLQLSFDVFDEWNHSVLSSTKKTRKRSKGRIKTATLENAKGKYFVRVFAQGRGDAGRYRLTVDFREAVAGPMFDPLKLEIPEPPRLAAVPEPDVPCDVNKFDQNLPACRSVCPEFGAPPGWPACKGKCPNPPDINNSDCWDKIPCTNPPDRRLKKCKLTDFPKCPDINNPDPQNPNCDNAKAPPVNGRVMKTEVKDNDLLITIAGGSQQGVKKGWRAYVLRGSSEEPLSGGDVVIIRIDKTSTLGRVKLTPDQIQANSRVKIVPPL